MLGTASGGAGQLSARGFDRLSPMEKVRVEGNLWGRKGRGDAAGAKINLGSGPCDHGSL